MLGDVNRSFPGGHSLGAPHLPQPSLCIQVMQLSRGQRCFKVRGSQVSFTADPTATIKTPSRREGGACEAIASMPAKYSQHRSVCTYTLAWAWALLLMHVRKRNWMTSARRFFLGRAASANASTGIDDLAPTHDAVVIETAWAQNSDVNRHRRTFPPRMSMNSGEEVCLAFMQTTSQPPTTDPRVKGIAGESKELS